MGEFVLSSLPEFIFARPFYATKHKFTNRVYNLTELVYVTSGALEISFDKYSFIVKENEYLLIPQGSVVNCKIASGYSHNAHLGLAFVSDCSFGQAELKPKVNCHHYVKMKMPLYGVVEKADRFEQIFTSLITSFSNDQTLDCCSLLFSIFSLLSQQANDENLKLDLTPSNKKYTLKMINYINSNFDKNLTIPEIAKVVLLSPSYASAIFKIVQGESIKSYIAKVKTRHAMLLLAKTPQSLFEVSTSIGINDNLPYFFRFFKKHTGMTPTEYKRLVQYKDLDIKLPDVFA